VDRSTHLREPRRYFAVAARGPEWRRVPAGDLPFEFAMNQLRLNAGFAELEFSLRTGLAVSTVEPTLRRLASQGLLERRLVDVGTLWQPTLRGRQLLNDVVQRFLPESISEGGTRS